MKNLDKRKILIVICVVIFILAIITSLFGKRSNKIHYDDSKVTITFEDTIDTSSDNYSDSDDYETEFIDSSYSTEFYDNTELSTEDFNITTEEPSTEVKDTEVNTDTEIGTDPEELADDSVFIAEYNFDYVVGSVITNSLSQDNRVNCTENLLNNLNSFVIPELDGKFSEIMLYECSFEDRIVGIKYNNNIYKFTFELDSLGKLNNIIKQ